MNILDLYDLIRDEPLMVRSAYNGKVLCHRYNPKKHEHLSLRDVSTLRTEIKPFTNSNNYVRSTICAWVRGDVEYKQDMEGKK